MTIHADRFGRAAGHAELARRVAVASAAAAAVLYFLIGLGVISVGEAAAGGAPDLFAFGAMAGGAFVATAILLLRFASRTLWLLVALLQIAVVVGYVAAADIRTPPYELWGLLIKAAQLVVLGAVAYLFLQPGRQRLGDEGSPSRAV